MSTSFMLSRLIVSGAVVIILVSLIATVLKPAKEGAAVVRASDSETIVATQGDEVFSVKIERNPPQSKLDQLAVSSWSKWSGGPSKIPWTFKAKETMYLLEGKVKVTCEGYDGAFEIGGGDLVEFPKGMTVTWDVIEAVDKHYSLEK